tara:strand:- start:497 stop:1549 length:1053 start_codon:yes stop_codon:yes gene_type:complete
MAWEKLGTASVSGTTANTSWKELARGTLSSGADTINSGTFTAKDNIMVLQYNINSGSVRTGLRFNADSGNNYAHRRSVNGASDQTNTSHNRIVADTDVDGTDFTVSEFNNISAQEKLGILSRVHQSGSGAGNAPEREEMVGKWANTSSQITSIQSVNTETGDFDTGSEIVVLGYDNDEADSGTNFWQELASVTRTDSGSTLESGNFTAKKYLMVEVCTIPANNGFKGRLEFGHSNGTMDTGSNYADRYEQDGGSDSTNASHQYIYAYTNHDDNIQRLRMFIVNKSDKEKLVLWWANSGGSSTGAGNVPQRRNGVAKWTNTSNQITNIRLNNQVAGGDAASGSFIKVYGAD